MSNYSTKNLSTASLEEIKQALQDLDFGSVEIYVQSGEITQITKKTIKKTAGKSISNNKHSHLEKRGYT